MYTFTVCFYTSHPIHIHNLTLKEAIEHGEFYLKKNEKIKDKTDKITKIFIEEDNVYSVEP